MSQYEISVIVPIYNAGKYLKQCVDSILMQTRKGIEVVLVNDGSTDDCPSIIDEYAQKNKNVVAVHQENRGLAAARVSGLQHACGKYIGWVDADDFVAPSMYEELYICLQENKADYVYCDYEFYPHKVPSKEKWFKQYQGYVDWHYLERNNQVWNTLTSRKLLDDLHIVDLYPIFEEYSWIAVLLNAKKTVVLNKALYFYRVGMDSMSGGSYKGKVPKFRHQVEMTKDLPQLINGTRYESTLKDYFEYRQIYTLLQLAIVAAINSDKQNYDFACEELKAQNYRSKPLVKDILDYNHGKKKSFVVRNMIPLSYWVAKPVTSIVYRN